MAKSWRTVAIYRIADSDVARCAGRYLGGRLIDIGCGTKPYSDLLRPHVTAHVGLDRADPFNRRARVDVVGDADRLPFENCSFDSALSTAALEHLAEPEIAVRECFRVLKAGGHAVYQVPFIWHLHAVPWDFYRFTSYGLSHLFTKAGFEVIEVRALSGFWVTFATMWSYYLGRFHRGPLRLLPVIPLACVIVQRLALVVDRLESTTEWSWMHTIVARKPEAVRQGADS